MFRFPPATANSSLSLAEPPRGHFYHDFVSGFSQYSPSDAINPGKGGGESKRVLDLESHDFGTFRRVGVDLSQAKQVR